MLFFKFFFVLFFADLAFAGIVDHVGTSFEYEFGKFSFQLLTQIGTYLIITK